MLKLHRPKLDTDLQNDLLARQKAVDENQTVPDAAWDDFKDNEDKRADSRSKTVLATLGVNGKCAYCESDSSLELDHHWPKKPHKKLNQNKGTASKLFQWENLVPSCHTCNSWECKGSHMKWTIDGRTMLLNPYIIGDDPLCHFDIVTDDGPVDGNCEAWQIGWIELRKGLSDSAEERAAYTRSQLKLNLRKQLLDGRKSAIQYFRDYLEFLKQFGPDHKIREDRTIRIALAQMLDPAEPYLAPIRQILRRDTALRDELFAKMPELKSIIGTWDVEPDDCSVIM